MSESSELGNDDSEHVMSASELRNALYDKLQNRGMLDSLKSQLRNFMVAELSRQPEHLKQKKDRKHRSQHGKKSSLQKRIVDSLVYSYLCASGCDYTVGVFLPETEMSQREILNEGELADLLRLDSHQQRLAGDQPLLRTAVQQLLKSQAERVVDNDTQTDPDHHANLVDKLSSIDVEFSSRTPSNDKLSVEERLAAYQRRIELVANQKAQEDLERWKQLQIETIRVTEREKQQKDLHDKKRQLEEEYRKRIEAVSEREKSLSGTMKTEFETVQRETFQQRQSLLQQGETIRLRDAELREQKDHMNRLQKMNEDKLEKMEKLLKHREEEVISKELHLENTLRVQRERITMEEKLAYDSKLRDLNALEASVKDKAASVERERRSLLSDNERKELFEKRQRCDELDAANRKYGMEIAGLEMQISGLRERLTKVYDYDVMRDSNVSLKKDLDLVKERLDTMMKENSILREKYEDALRDVKDKGGPDYILLKNQLQRDRDKAIDDKVICEHRLREMETKFKEQLHKNQMMVREFGLQTERQKYMNKEHADLRKSMGLSSNLGATRGLSGHSPQQDVSYYDTSFGRTLPRELLLDGDLELSSAGEVSSATEESIVTETRKRLQGLELEADTLHAAFQSLSRQQASPIKPTPKKPMSMKTGSPNKSVSFHGGSQSLHAGPEVRRAEQPFHIYSKPPPQSIVKPTESIVNQDELIVTDDEVGSPILDQSHPPQLNLTQSDLWRADNSASSATQRSHPSLQASDHGNVESIKGLQQNTGASFVFSPVVEAVQASECPVSQETPPAANESRVTSLADKWASASPTPDVQEQPTPGVQDQAAAESASLDSQWKSSSPSKPVVSLDDQWKSPSANTQSSLQMQSAQTAEPKSENENAGIDPMMLKYMQMVKQAKEVDNKPAASESKPSVAEPVTLDKEDSISDNVSLDAPVKRGEASDEDFW